MDKTWKLVIKGPKNHLYLLQFHATDFAEASEMANRIRNFLNSVILCDALQITKLVECTDKNPNWGKDSDE